MVLPQGMFHLHSGAKQRLAAGAHRAVVNGPSDFRITNTSHAQAIVSEASTHEVTMRLAAFYHFAAIRIERVIDDPGCRIMFVIVLEAEMSKAFGDSFKARSLRLVVQRVIGIGTIDDPPKQHQRGIAGQIVLLQDRFERTFLAVMTKLDILDVIGNGIEALRLRHHLLSRHEHELGVLIDELLDEPWACDAVNLDLFAGDPFHSDSPVWLLVRRTSG